MPRSRPALRRAVAAAVVVAAVACQLLAGAADHDPLAHADERDGTCVVCVLGHVHEAAPPAAEAPVGPAPEHLPIPEAVTSQHAAPLLLDHPARGPPAHA